MHDMTSKFALSMAGGSDAGRAREHNEDYIAWDTPCGLALLADGMGGHRAGEVASRLCVESLNEILLPALQKPLRLRPNKGVSRHATLVRRAINKANTRVYEDAHSHKERKGMGTTLVLALFYQDRVVIAHAGDSRLYRLRKNHLEPLTTDHSLVQELFDKGTIGPEDLVDNPYSHVITRAVGLIPKLKTEIRELEARQDDLYLLCSDGLTDLVDDATIEQELRQAQGDRARAVHKLIDLANRRGGHDNISVLLVALQAGNRG